MTARMQLQLDKENYNSVNYLKRVIVATTN